MKSDFACLIAIKFGVVATLVRYLASTFVSNQAILSHSLRQHVALSSGIHA